MAGSRNRHPFGEQSKAGLRLWTGRGAAYSPAHKRVIPLDPLVAIGKVESVAHANAYIRKVERKVVQKIGGVGFEHAIFIEQSNTWWMVTGEANAHTQKKG